MSAQTRRAFLSSAIATAAAIALKPTLNASPQRDEFHGPPWRQPVASSKTITVANATIHIDLAPGTFNLPEDAIIRWITRAAQAVTTYYGRFPVPSARIYVQSTPGSGVFGGTTWGNVGGSPAFTRIHVGQNTTQADLDTDWMMTHEIVHYALPSLPDENHWLEEGIAVYVEPIARVQSGQLAEAGVWHDMIENMPKGQPRDGDLGLDNTHTWGRTYWGGAGFCLLADVTLRKQTQNRTGLQQALRAILTAGGNISQNWDILPTLQAADKATGTQVLTTLYQSMSTKPVPIDFTTLWQQLGVTPTSNTVTYNPKAPLAKVRQSIFATAS
ncbi:hypothetical protein [Edaphobacter acidisoli]|nr:hypothetical protein [Edaphobacter acidisoli]